MGLFPVKLQVSAISRGNFQQDEVYPSVDSTNFPQYARQSFQESEIYNYLAFNKIFFSFRPVQLELKNIKNSHIKYLW